MKGIEYEVNRDTGVRIGEEIYTITMRHHPVTFETLISANGYNLASFFDTETLPLKDFVEDFVSWLDDSELNFMFDSDLEIHFYGSKADFELLKEACDKEIWLECECECDEDEEEDEDEEDENEDGDEDEDGYPISSQCDGVKTCDCCIFHSRDVFVYYKGEAEVVEIEEIQLVHNSDDLTTICSVKIEKTSFTETCFINYVNDTFQISDRGIFDCKPLDEWIIPFIEFLLWKNKGSQVIEFFGSTADFGRLEQIQKNYNDKVSFFHIGEAGEWK